MRSQKDNTRIEHHDVTQIVCAQRVRVVDQAALKTCFVPVIGTVINTAAYPRPNATIELLVLIQ